MSSHAIIYSREHHTLTVSVEQAPLGQVLQELAHRLSVKITLKDFEGYSHVSTRFTHLPLERGIEQLLHGHDYALLYSRPDSLQRTYLKEIIVLSRPDAVAESAKKQTTVVMLPKENSQETLQALQPAPVYSPELPQLELTELANQIESLVRLSDQKQAQGISASTRNLNATDLTIETKAIELLKRLESPLP